MFEEDYEKVIFDTVSKQFGTDLGESVVLKLPNGARLKVSDNGAVHYKIGQRGVEVNFEDLSEGLQSYSVNFVLDNEQLLPLFAITVDNDEVGNPITSSVVVKGKTPNEEGELVALGVIGTISELIDGNEVRSVVFISPDNTTTRLICYLPGDEVTAKEDLGILLERLNELRKTL